MMRVNLLILLYFLLSGLSAQPVRFEQLHVEHGLSQNTVNCILKDSRGYLWIGTNDGLNRYDGYQFSIFRNDRLDSTSLSDNKVYALLEDRDGNLWIGTKNGLNLYDRRRNAFKRYMRRGVEGQSLSENFVRSLLQDRAGRLWVGTIDGELSLWDLEDGQFRPVPLHDTPSGNVPVKDMASILEDHRGEIWLATTAPGLFHFDPERRQAAFLPFHPQGRGEGYPKKIYEDSAGQIWVATQGDGVYRLDKRRENYRHFSSDNGALRNDIAKDVVEDEKGRIWIGTDGGGISIFYPEDQSFSYLNSETNQPFSLGSNAVYTFFKDNEGILWVGTFDAGISIYNRNRKKFHFAGVDNVPGKGLSHRSVLCFLEDNLGRLWIGTDGGGLNRFDPQRSTFTYFRHEEGSNQTVGSDVITALYQDRRQRLWIGTYQGGLQCMKNGRIEASFRHDPGDPHSLRNNNVWSILEDRQDRLWIGTLGGLDLLDPASGRFAHIPTQNNIHAPHLERVTELYEDRNGRIWVGGKGVRYYDPGQSALQKLQGEAGLALATYDIRAFYEDRQGRFWVATEGGGLFLLDRRSGQVRAFTVADGLPSNAIHTILEDDTGFLWMSTNQGVSRLSPERLLSGPSEEVASAFRNYCRKDGLQSNQFSYSAALKSRTGALYFGGINGFNYFFPEEIQDNPYRPKVEITALKIYDRYVDVHSENSPLERPISELRELTLPYGQSSVFSLEFTALNFTSSDKNQYAYKLEGFIDDWSYVGQQRSVTFTNLNPGTYTFRVKASNNDGIWNEEGTSLQLTILPPWWKTNWAYGGYILIFMLVLLAFRYTLLLRERMKNDLKIKDLERAKVEEVNRLKLAFFTNISHELRTPLTLITAPVERLLSSPDIKNGARQQLLMVRRNTGRLLRLVNQLLEFRKIEDNKVKLNPRKGDVVHFVQSVKEVFDDLAAMKEVTFLFSSEFETLPAVFDPDKLEKILYNLLSNAFKFAKDRVTLRLRVPLQEERPGRELLSVCLEVEDDGPGIPPDQQALVFERFYQIDRVKKDGVSLEATGAGIGLAYARALAELHGGEIRLESQPGCGACFTVLLPLQPPGTIDLSSEWIEVEKERPTMVAPFVLPAESGESTLGDRLTEVLAIAQTNERPLMLVVEDHEEVRGFIRDSFQQHFRVLEAPDGLAGEALALKHIPDIVISDIMMPGKDGIALCRALKSDERTSHIPILLLTANTNEERWLQGLETGADDYVTKPFRLRLLEARVLNLIRNRALLRQHFSRQVLQPGPLEIESADQAFLRKAVALVEANLSEPEFGVTEFARQLGMSRSVLYRKFSALTDLPVKEFINMIRLKRAAQLLVSDAGLSVAEVAYSVGFSDSQYFSKKFKKFYHCTPTQFAETKGESTV